MSRNRNKVDEAYFIRKIFKAKSPVELISSHLDLQNYSVNKFLTKIEDSFDHFVKFVCRKS